MSDERERNLPETVEGTESDDPERNNRGQDESEGADFEGHRFNVDGAERVVDGAERVVDRNTGD